MKYIIAFIALCMLAVSVSAHEMTPTYPKFRQSHMSGIKVTSMYMFNKRSDVEYYEIGVFDEDWNAVPFVSKYNIFKLEYLGHVKFDIYVRSKDLDKVEYICSKSKIKKDSDVRTTVSSKICSRIK